VVAKARDVDAVALGGVDDELVGGRLDLAPVDRQSDRLFRLGRHDAPTVASARAKGQPPWSM
jgi:hypothetical protein